MNYSTERAAEPDGKLALSGFDALLLFHAARGGARAIPTRADGKDGDTMTFDESEQTIIGVLPADGWQIG